MNVIIEPKKLKGIVKIPPSKSQSHRAIIASALSKGKSIIENVSYSEDILATIHALEKIGVKFQLFSNYMIVHGVHKISFVDENIIDCNESGSTIRFLIPIFALSKHKTVLTGKRSLFKRPMSVYENIFKAYNLLFQKSEDSIILQGEIKKGVYEIPGNVSSQFISGLLLALPLVKGDSKIIITGNLESKQYVDMTLETLKKHQIIIHKTSYGYEIPGNQKYTAFHHTIEGDFSQMAFYAVLGQISGPIECRNVPQISSQPDKAILDIINEMNGYIQITEKGYQFKPSLTQGTTIDVSQCPDIAPILGILAGLSEGKTNIINAKRLKMKESNRLLATYEILSKLGVQVTMFDDSLEIIGRDYFEGGTFESYNDHRIVMSLAIASSRSKSPIYIQNAQAVKKSYPDFFTDLTTLGASINFIEE